MEYNEIIGVGAAALAIIGIIGFILTLNFWLFVLIFVGMLIEVTFLSFWGLDTFNPWIEKKLKL